MDNKGMNKNNEHQNYSQFRRKGQNNKGYVTVQSKIKMKIMEIKIKKET